MKKKDVLDGIVEYVDYPNRSVVMIEGKRVVVKNAIPGQKIRFRVLKTREGKASGRLLEVLEKSPLQTEDKACDIFPACGGCLYQTVPYEEQLKIKKEQVYKLLSPYFDENTQFDGIKASPSPWAYRNKMEFSFGNEVKNGPLTLGLHRRASTYDVLTATTCKLVHEDLRKILQATLEYVQEQDFKPYNKIRHDGYMRYLLVRRSEKTGEVLVCLVTSTEQDHNFDPWAKRLQELELEGSFAGIIHAHCDCFADDVKAEDARIIYGKDWITEELLGLNFKISLFSFFQTNSAGAEV
ncbi:MAG: class I SAM-dependent RNA methyltransferase, partial [Lachnospiraceae bacterium]|nr:class I SAM-dependent RNA methyltransferase [Candidatus Equihabitans merdae]